jgi:heme/copper-type cytochrome/quinol oxidase subunit 2
MLRTVIAAGLLTFAAFPAAADMPQIPIVLQNHQFAPSEVAVPAGVRVELRIHNRQNTPAEFESSSLHREQVMTPGATVSVYVGPLDPGQYEFFDDFHNATRGQLVVK